MFKKWLLLLILLGNAASNAYALISFNVADNQTKKINISANDLTRIYVKDERIQNVRGLEGAYLLIKDAKQGQIYLKPTSPYQRKPFSLFITTEEGHNYNLVVTPYEKLTGQVIELKTNAPNKRVPLWEKNSSYSDILIKLITSMVRDEGLEGYSISIADKIKPIKYTKYDLTLTKTYRGSHLYGEKFILKNNCSETLALDEVMFYKYNTRAVALTETNVPSKSQTYIYRVSDDE